MTPKDWTLVVVATADGRVSPVQLQKALFLIGRVVPSARRGNGKFYHFEPYDYGPFQQQIYRDAEQLREEGLLSIEDLGGGRGYREYVATAAGRRRAQALREQLDAGVQAYLDGLVAWVRSLSFNDLVRAIYARYPEMKAQCATHDDRGADGAPPDHPAVGRSPGPGMIRW